MTEAMLSWISGFFSGAAVTIAIFYAVGKFRDMADEDSTVRARSKGEW